MPIWEAEFQFRDEYVDENKQFRDKTERRILQFEADDEESAKEFANRRAEESYGGSIEYPQEKYSLVSLKTIEP